MSGLHDGSQGVGNKCGYRSPCHGQEANEQEVGKGMIYNFDVLPNGKHCKYGCDGNVQNNGRKGFGRMASVNVEPTCSSSTPHGKPNLKWRNGNQYFTMPATSMSGLWGMHIQV